MGVNSQRESSNCHEIRRFVQNGEGKVTAIYSRKAIILLLCLADFARSFAIIAIEIIIALDEWDLLISNQQTDEIQFSPLETNNITSYLYQVVNSTSSQRKLEFYLQIFPDTQI